MIAIAIGGLLEHFELSVANDERERDQVFALRHRIFREELGYFTTPQPQLGLEQDEHDDYSIHCLLRDRANGMAVGCVRVVMPENHAHRLPLEAHWPSTPACGPLHPSRFEPWQVCEISRLAVVRDYRLNGDKSAALPMSIGLLLYLAAGVMIKNSHRPCAYAVMEPSLPRLLKRFGLHFAPAGEVIELYGRRGFYLNKTAESTVDGLRSDAASLYRHLLQMTALSSQKQLRAAVSVACPLS
ncbi:PEP-CTERM/exosortase system-associated acyltransferase [Halotalea alkalilenta]|uniref:PEP-CTERM/exosortase system-associated acyltransferase n=1 Tax=Halotalea alkalilenta TaxID=376489 RepID=UPI000480B9C9|nr:PEP-CTERM/exosortase system-associated acyltransferase [Halotalea alkalilenta]